MDESAKALIERVRTARTALRAAAESTDTLAMGQALDELETALRLARESGVTVPPDADGEAEQDRSGS